MEEKQEFREKYRVKTAQKIFAARLEIFGEMLEELEKDIDEFAKLVNEDSGVK